MLVDSHCHLEFPDFDSDRQAVLTRARARGIGRIVTISTRVRAFGSIRAIVEQEPDVFCSIGTHPHNADEEVDVTIDELVHLARHEKVVAIGEAGLDYHYKRSTPENQAASFRRHIAAARETGLPLVVHARDADAHISAILKDEAGKGAFPAVLHCYSSGRELATTGISLGFYVSFSGILTFRNAEAIRSLAAELPEDRILVETDAPYLAPAPHRGKRNEPAFVADTAAVLASVRGVSEDEIAELTTENFFRLFSRVPR
jgi:TatD DNase family protein